MSQTDIAAQLGVTQQTYAKIEANPARTSVETLFTILRLLGSEIVLAQPVEQSAPKPKKATVAAPFKLIPPSKKAEHW
jgi:HTH-type transcriptional regulator/antitoxin HipB